ncbi:hypothetical protein M595_5999 [Lyngbya aestuarii BL J]|uniref:Uncharacterized protein n=1 Tax=Lyngbya aestuarii BL J TaxID=1348334 RepID=U7Q8A4_9CYAN|nr:hypothetical protein [Lyngbya aestuarii]ERT04059.1 hypothetical protein M595_5999 [Lyngbya aestuarii BL J]
MKIINPEQSYTFSKIFELKIEPKDLAKYFGYSFSRTKLNLSQYQGDLDRVDQLKERIEEILPYASLSSEQARREILISPLIFDLIHYTKSEIFIEYSIKVSEQLQGNLDYFLENVNSLLVIEAKKEDLDYGMSQLIAELIALEQWQENKQQTHLVGAVTTGKIWEFARLNREQKQIEQGLESYRVPEDIEPLMRILVQALS